MHYKTGEIGRNWSKFFLGGNDREVEGVYRWSDGTPLSSSSGLWASGQPDDYEGAEDCVNLRLNRQMFALNDISCSFISYFICQYD